MSALEKVRAALTDPEAGSPLANFAAVAIWVAMTVAMVML